MGRSKVPFAALFLFLTVSAVNAYTVVMRDGRRVEIPNEFTVTNSTLPYDVARMGAVRQTPVEIPWAYPFGGFPAFGPFDNFGFGITSGPFGRFRRSQPSPFDNFLATPITPFPRVPFTGRRNVFTPRVNIAPRPMHRGHGRRR